LTPNKTFRTGLTEIRLDLCSRIDIWGNINTYRHNLSPFSNDSRGRIDEYGRAVQSTAGLFDQSSGNEDTSLSRDLLQKLPCSISTAVRSLGHRKLALDPVIACSCGGVAEVHSSLEILEELLPTVRSPGTKCGAKIAGSRISSQISLREKQELHSSRCGMLGDALQSGKCGSER
jgi:hypothetical protein